MILYIVSNVTYIVFEHEYSIFIYVFIKLIAYLFLGLGRADMWVCIYIYKWPWILMQTKAYVSYVGTYDYSLLFVLQLVRNVYLICVCVKNILLILFLYGI